MLTGIHRASGVLFLFVAPVLLQCRWYWQVVHMIAHILNIAVGLYILRWILRSSVIRYPFRGNAKTSWIRIIPVGIIYFFLYYFIFSFLIKKLDLKTPGREDNDEETKALYKADVNARKAWQYGSWCNSWFGRFTECGDHKRDLEDLRTLKM